MKRLLSAIIALILLVSSTAGAVLAGKAAEGSASCPMITVGSAKGSKGDTVELVITLSGNPGIIALGLKITYDKNSLQLVGAEDAGILGKSTAVFSDSCNTVPFIMMWEDALASKNYTSNGTIATLKFKITSDLKAGGAAVRVEVTDAYNYDLADVKFTSSDGRITPKAAATTTAAPTKTTTATTTGKTTTAKLPDTDTTVSRLSGKDRITTAVAISKAGWKKANNVVLAYAMNYPDALAGAPLAYALDAPILLTANKESLESAVMDEIERLGAKKVYILGGTSAVNERIGSKLKAGGLAVERISGSSRYETAAAIAEKLVSVTGSKPKEVFVVSGVNFPDALAVSSIAAIRKCPILFTPAMGETGPATSGFITAKKVSKVILLGGTAAVSDDAVSSLEKLGVRVERIAGSDRYATALAICSKYDKVFKGNGAVIATGANFPDALAGGAYAAKKGVPVILVGGSVSSGMKDYVQSLKCKEVTVLGGVNAVSDQVAYSLFEK